MVMNLAEELLLGFRCVTHFYFLIAIEQTGNIAKIAESWPPLRIT